MNRAQKITVVASAAIAATLPTIALIKAIKNRKAAKDIEALIDNCFKPVQTETHPY